MAKRKSRRPAPAKSPSTSYAVERAIARSEGKDPEALPLPPELGPPPAGMSTGAAHPDVIARARAEGAAAERARIKAEKEAWRAKIPAHSKYTTDLADRICVGISDSKSLRRILDEMELELKKRIHPSTVFRWLARHEEFRDNYARARVLQADTDADQIKELVVRVVDPTIEEALRLDPNAARVAIDALKWSAARRNPKVYGDKVEVSNNPEAPFTVIETVIVQPSIQK